MRSVYSGPWNKVMGVALVGSIAACVLLATRVNATARPSASAYDALPLTSSADCSDVALHYARATLARNQRDIACDPVFLPALRATTSIDEIQLVLDTRARAQELTNWRSRVIAEKRGLLTACGASTTVDICAGFDRQEVEDRLARLSEYAGRFKVNRYWLERVTMAQRELALCGTR